MTTIFTNIQQLINTREETKALYGLELRNLPIVEDAYLLIEDDQIAGYGKMSAMPASYSTIKNCVDATGRLILPCWCDSHTHLVFAGSRENEFVDKIKGLSYAEIAERGGGIINSSNRLRSATDDELFDAAWKRLEEVNRLGTGCIEIKSGYGLDTDSELRMLRVIKKLKECSRMSIRSTFLGAHTYPPKFRENHKGYIDCIINEMLPVVANEKLADYIDVFCEKSFFSAEETEIICRAGISLGLRPKLHVNQLNSIGGIETGVKLDALSLDHLETLTENEIELLSISSANRRWTGVCTLLPTAAFFLRMPFQPARALIDTGCAVAIASDYNPGSSPSGNMNLVVAMSCIQMKMLPEEAINAATVNGAFAMDMLDRAGSITQGKMANIILTKPVPSLAYLPYSFGSNHIENVMIRGAWVQ